MRKHRGPTVSQLCADYCEVELGEVKWKAPAGVGRLEATHGPTAGGEGVRRHGCGYAALRLRILPVCQIMC